MARDRRKCKCSQTFSATFGVLLQEYGFEKKKSSNVIFRKNVIDIFEFRITLNIFGQIAEFYDVSYGLYLQALVWLRGVLYWSGWFF